MIWRDFHGLPDTCFVFKGSFNIELAKIPLVSRSADFDIVESSTVAFFFASVVAAIYTSVLNVVFGSFCAQARGMCGDEAVEKAVQRDTGENAGLGAIMT